MKIDVRGILEALKNTHFPAKELKELIDQTAEQRKEICNTCPFFSPNAEIQGYKPSVPRFDQHCISCGCSIFYKTRCLSCECPQGKWGAVVTEVEDQKLFDRAKEENEKSNKKHTN